MWVNIVKLALQIPPLEAKFRVQCYCKGVHEYDANGVGDNYYSVGRSRRWPVSDSVRRCPNDCDGK